MKYIPIATKTIILHHEVFFYHCAFSLMGNRVPHNLGSGHLMRPIPELSTSSAAAAHHHILHFLWSSRSPFRLLKH